jgi:hypothetical protein
LLTDERGAFRLCVVRQQNRLVYQEGMLVADRMTDHVSTEAGSLPFHAIQVSATAIKLSV